MQEYYRVLGYIGPKVIAFYSKNKVLWTFKVHWGLPKCGPFDNIGLCTNQEGGKVRVSSELD